MIFNKKIKYLSEFFVLGILLSGTMAIAETPVQSQVAQLSTDANKPREITSRDALFGLDSPKPTTETSSTSGWRGFLQAEAARAYRDPDHWWPFVSL